MKQFELSAKEFCDWLKLIGIETQDEFWTILVTNCHDGKIFDHQFVVDRSSWPGFAQIEASFVLYKHLRELGWVHSSANYPNNLDNEIYVISVALKVMIKPTRKLLTPNVVSFQLKPVEFVFEIDLPSISEISDSWNMLSSFANKISPEVNSIQQSFETAFYERLTEKTEKDYRPRDVFPDIS